MALHGNMMLAPAGGYSGYQIDQSMVLDGSSDYLSWTPAVAGTDSTRFSFSCFLKFCEFDRAQSFFSAGSSNTNRTDIAIVSSNKIQFTQRVSSSTISNVSTNAVFRDPGSWYHVVVIYNSNEASSSDRIKIIVNGVEQTLTHTDAIDSARAVHFAAANEHAFGLRVGTPSQYFNGYIADPRYLDGQVGSATDFGEFYNGTTQWRAIQPSVTYGTNGFYLPFTQDTPNLGVDYSGNGNDWTENGSPVQSSDSPTVNYATLNPLDDDGTTTISNGNLSWRGAGDAMIASTIHVNNGKWYAEIIIDAVDGTRDPGIGIVQSSAVRSTANPLTQSIGYWCVGPDGDKAHSSLTSYGSAFIAGDIMMLAVDLDDGKIWWGKNGTWFNSGDPAAGTGEGFSSIDTSIFWAFAQCASEVSSTGEASWVFADDDLTYSPPTGYQTLAAANLPEVTITDPGEYFNVVEWTGTGASNARTGLGHQTGLLWGKRTNGVGSHYILNEVTGVLSTLSSDTTAAEDTSSSVLTSFDSDGFTLPADAAGYLNYLNREYVGWSWAGSGTSGSSNSDGSITSTVSVNDDAGFSIVSYTGTGSAGTVGHGLSAAEMIVAKQRSTASYQWMVYHRAIGGTKYLRLDATTAETTGSSVWNNSDPTGSVFSVGTSHDVNKSSDNFIAYCFRSIPGYSKVFSYTGNGSADGTFVWLGFRPAFVMIKNSSSATNWKIFDSAREPDNLVGAYLEPNTAAAEANLGGGNTTDLDFLSNGFKLRGNASTINNTGSNHIGIAFAENPFGGSNLPLGLAR